MPVCIALSNSLLDKVNIEYSTSEQLVELRELRKRRDNNDTEKLVDWLFAHSSFPQCPELIAINSGIKAGDTINSDQAVKVGITTIIKIVGCFFANLHLTVKIRYPL